MGIGFLTPVPIYLALIIKVVKRCLGSKKKNLENIDETEEAREMLKVTKTVDNIQRI